MNWCFFGMLCVFSLNGYSQNTTAGARLDKSSILLGDQTTLRLSVSLPANGKIEFPILSDTISAKVQIVDIGKLDTVKDASGRWVISRAYTITAFDAGVQTIPAFKFIGPDGQLLTDPIPLQVQEVKVDTTKGVFDIKQPMTVKYGFMDWLKDNWGLLLAETLLPIVLIGIWLYYRKHKKVKPVIVEVKPAIPADLTAINKLHALRDKKLWQQEEVKQYHSELTDILREYLEQRFNIPAMEQTSEEIFGSIKDRDITPQNKEILREILLLSDLVKFAKQKPQAEDNEQSIENALAFVSASRIVNPPENKIQQDDELN
ncbi:BatD family protein [Pedobacter sp. UYP24]